MSDRMGPIRILIVDDDDDSRALMSRALRAVGYQITEAADGVEATALDLRGFDVVLTDLQMPRMGGREVLERVRAQSPHTPVIAFTAYANAESALDLMAGGAYDYLPRPVDLGRLKHLVQRALEWRRLATENEALRREGASSASREPTLVGTSPAMLEVYKVVAQVAPTIATVLITGESGTGKELVARTLHARSGRSGPFVMINCGSLREDALMTELFGREGAGERVGAIEEANGGTIFLDDIQDASPKVQAALLHVLEEHVVRRGGEAKPVDVRFVASATSDLHGEAADGEFREDLLFRLQVVTVVVPPLAARREDLPLLIEHFVNHYAALLGRPAPALAPDARQALVDHDWPGNVRELAQTLERAVVLARGGVVTKDDLPNALRRGPAARGATSGIENDWPTLATVERRYIDRVLQHTGGNTTRAAVMLGIDRRTLSRLFARERAAAALTSPHDAAARESN
ncbi:MAG: sigma-54 dependent transcriptional regulator [Polyangiales bacterium]